jgi:hypothetical protein
VQESWWANDEVLELVNSDKIDDFGVSARANFGQFLLRLRAL